LVDPERHDRVGVLLVAEALIGVGRIEDLVCWIEASSNPFRSSRESTNFRFLFAPGGE
jgi:hypothetical protein